MLLKQLLGLPEIVEGMFRYPQIHVSFTFGKAQRVSLLRMFTLSKRYYSSQIYFFGYDGFDC